MLGICHGSFDFSSEEMIEIDLPQVCQTDEEDDSSLVPYQRFVEAPATASLSHGYYH